MEQNQIIQALNLAPAKQESRLPASGEEIQFEVAIKDQKIFTAAVESLKEVLRLVMTKIGLRAANWPSDMEKNLLVAHILQNFGGHTISEIKLAFEMAIAGKLDVEVNCYENFSCLYFSNIMNAYREWAKEVYKLLPAPIPVMIEENKEITDEDMQEWVDYLVSDFQNVKILLIPVTVYDWLDRKGLINLTTKEKYQLINGTAVSIRENFLNENAKEYSEELSSFLTMKQKGCFTGNEVNRLKDIAKKIAVHTYLQNKFQNQ